MVMMRANPRFYVLIYTYSQKITEMRTAGVLALAIALRNTARLTCPMRYAVSQKAPTSWCVEIHTEMDGMEDTLKLVELATVEILLRATRKIMK